MTAQTTRLDIPYPVGSDPFGAIDTYIQAVADRVEELLGGPTASGVVNCDVVTANTDTTVVVNFPAGRFSAGETIQVVCTPKGVGLANQINWSVGTITSASFTLTFRRTSTADFDMMWIATSERA